MPPSVKRPIKVAARETAIACEPHLLDTLTTLSKLVEHEKTLITGGLDQSHSGSLQFIAQHYFKSKDALQTLQNITNHGLNSEHVQLLGLVNLLNVNSSQWQMDSFEREKMQPLIDFVEEYGHELAGAAGRKATRYNDNAQARREAQAELCKKIENYEERFGENRARQN